MRAVSNNHTLLQHNQSIHIHHSTKAIQADLAKQDAVANAAGLLEELRGRGGRWRRCLLSDEPVAICDRFPKTSRYTLPPMPCWLLEELTGSRRQVKTCLVDS
jgi:hypothetical protein